MEQNMRGRCFEAEDVTPGQPTDAKVALDLITKMVKERYQTDSSQHAPMIFAFCEGSVATIFQLDFSDVASKNASINVAARHMRELGCDASVAVSEGWGLKQPSTSAIQIPSQSPDRVEMLMLEASAKGQHISALYEMIRAPNGEFLSFKTYSYVEEREGSELCLKTKFDFFN